MICSVHVVLAVYSKDTQTFVSLLGLTDPVLIRLDVDSKLSEQLKVGHFVVPYCLPTINFFVCSTRTKQTHLLC